MILTEILFPLDQLNYGKNSHRNDLEKVTKILPTRNGNFSDQMILPHLAIFDFLDNFRSHGRHFYVNLTKLILSKTHGAVVGIRHRNEKSLTHPNCSINCKHHCYYFVHVRNEVQRDCGSPQVF